MSTHPDLAHEQAHLDRAYARVEALKDVAKSAMDDVLDLGRGGTFQARTERDMVVRSSLARLDQLEIGNQPLCFGRIDEVSGETYYIGRLGVSDETQEVLVVDWRAPVAEPFYRATGRFPMGLTRRRHFALQGRQITGIEDEPMIHSGDTEALSVSGRGALLAALERSRSGRMSDIIATIQGEQDEIIRSPLGGVQVVQGGPGTGKTAVALHRAAYLLYTHRFPLEIQGVLVVGPNPVFLRYISQVLPSLGESGVTLSTISGLYLTAVDNRIAVAGVDTPATAAIKGDARMADLIENAIEDRERALAGDLTVGFGSYRLRIPRDQLKKIVSRTKRRGGTHNARRRRFEQMLFEALFQAYERAVERTQAYDQSATGSGFADFSESMHDNADVNEALMRMWPRLSAEEFLHDLFGARALIKLAAKNLLSEDEASLLYRKRSASHDEIAWTEGDIALLDEARDLLGPLKKLKDDEVFTPTYGHVVVDEAQDLTPMQLRMLSRRCLGGSLTMVGDIAQATGAWAPSSWSEISKHLPESWPVREVELTIGYRTPAEVMQLAAPVLSATGLGLTPPRPVREAHIEPNFIGVSDPAVISKTVVDHVLSKLDEVEGTFAIIVPVALLDLIASQLQELEVGFGSAAIQNGSARALDSRITLLTAAQSKGLEFDFVCVVEPLAIVDESPHGMRGLYVALTRTTMQLSVVFAQPLPKPLSDARKSIQQARDNEQNTN